MSEEKFPSQLAERFQIRLPDGMRDRLREEATKSGRSMNAEIVHRLANSLDNPKFEDMALGLGDEELDWNLMYEANRSGRSLREELIHRISQSFSNEATLINELREQVYNLQDKYNGVLKMFRQLSPDELRLLEERVEIAHDVSRNKIRSKEWGKFLKLNPIGNRGRFYLRQPTSNYSPILEEGGTESGADDDSSEV